MKKTQIVNYHLELPENGRTAYIDATFHVKGEAVVLDDYVASNDAGHRVVGLRKAIMEWLGENEEVIKQRASDEFQPVPSVIKLY